MAAGKTDATFTDLGLTAAARCFDGRVDLGHLAGGDDLLERRIRTTLLAKAKESRLRLLD